MKKNIKLKLICFVALSTISLVQGQALPTTAYGTWDRGDGVTNFSDPKTSFVLGIEIIDSWSDIQKNGPTTFDFSAIQTALDKALLYNKLVKLSISVGPDSPSWIYSNGVPEVIIGTTSYPHYTDLDYKKYYFALIKEFSLFLRNQPKNKFDRIAFVQVKTGSTGDEVPYKGTSPSDYTISDQKWEEFRIESFTEFKKYFNDVSDKKIVLQFNNVDPDGDPIANKYVMENIDLSIGFGIKGSAYNRGHHLTGEQSFKEQWVPYLINPKGIKLFASSEMDQSWDNPVFNFNYEIGFYWAVLAAINTGVSNTNVTKSAMTYVLAHPGIIDIYTFYNKYAQQVYPNKAIAVCSIFHEGLDAANTQKFPVSKYGAASKSNTQRYLNICNDPIYNSRGAKIEDPLMVVRGQVDQRRYQVGYNDAGWEIAEGNIERFLTQIKPDETSIGLFRVRGTITSTSSKYDRFARSFENATNKNTMYFKFDNELFVDTKPKNLTFTVTWLDKNAGSKWEIQYMNAEGTIQSILQTTGVGSNTWKKAILTISDLDVTKLGAENSNFRLVNTDNIDDIFHGIEIDIDRNVVLSVSPESTIDTIECVVVYPNPTKSKVQFQCSEEIKSVDVFDFNGKLLFKNGKVIDNSVDLSQFPKGVYILKIEIGNRHISYKIIKD